MIYKHLLFLNSANNTFLWKKKTKISAVSIYPTFFLGGAQNTTDTLVSFFDKTTTTWCTASAWSLNTKKIQNLYEHFFFSFNYFFFKKFKFTGKGYKIKKVKYKKSFQFFFGYSHKIYLIAGGCQLRKLTKYKLFLISNNKKKINKVTLIIKKIKPINLFTKRGLRAMKQKVFKRPGKKSTY